MKFENTKVGDIVYQNRKVRYGWGKSKWFTTPVKVTVNMDEELLKELKTILTKVHEIQHNT